MVLLLLACIRRPSAIRFKYTSVILSLLVIRAPSALVSCNSSTFGDDAVMSLVWSTMATINFCSRALAGVESLRYFTFLSPSGERSLPRKSCDLASRHRQMHDPISGTQFERLHAGYIDL